MEISVLTKLIKNRYKQLILAAIVGAVLGITLYYFLPVTYYATGALYVKRSVETNPAQYFSYEGYYGQQTAQAYTSTVMGLLDSADIKSQALEILGEPLTEKTLRNLSKNMTVKKSGSQLVTLTTKGTSPETAERMWTALTDSTLQTFDKLNRNGDIFLRISKVSQTPIVKRDFRNIYLNAFVGAGLVKLLTLIIFSLKPGPKRNGK